MLPSTKKFVMNFYLIDIDLKQAEGEAWDILQGNAFIPKRIKIIASDYSVCSELNVIVFTAGDHLNKDKHVWIR